MEGTNMTEIAKQNKIQKNSKISIILGQTRIYTCLAVKGLSIPSAV